VKTQPMTSPPVCRLTAPPSAWLNCEKMKLPVNWEDTRLSEDRVATTAPPNTPVIQTVTERGYTASTAEKEEVQRGNGKERPRERERTQEIERERYREGEKGERERERKERERDRERR